MKQLFRKKFSWIFTLAIAALMVVPFAAFADTITPDGDIVTAGDQGTVNLGTVAPGAILSPKVNFKLECAGNKHVDNGQTVTLTFTLPGSTVPAGGSLSATSASIGVIPASWPDDGDNNCSSVAPLGDNGDSTVTITAPTVAGNYTYNVAYTRSIGSPDITGGNPIATFTLTVGIIKTSTTTTVTCPASVTYTGAELTPCTATVTGAGGFSQPLTVSYTNTTNAGTATASANFAEDATHLGSTDAATFTIAAAGSTTAVTCPASVDYTGSAQTPCSASVTGAGGLNQALTVSYTNNTNAGTASASASYAGDANHDGSSGSTTFQIGSVGSTTTINCPASVTYNGAAQTPCTASVSGAGGLSQVLTVSYSNNTNAGTASASAAYAGDANHAGSNASTTFTIDKAGSTTTISCPASVTYNGSAQTPCTASVSGAGGLSQVLTVSYSNNTNAGTASASASFAEDDNHYASSDTKNFMIDQATSTTIVTCDENVTYNGSAQTPCTASVTGAGGLNETVSVSYTDNTNAGTASASATFAGDANHIGSLGTATFTIDQAPSTTTVICPTNMTYNGSAQTPCTASVSGAGGLNQSLSVSYSDNTNAGTATASASFAGDANHIGSSGSKNFTIDQAPSTTTVTCPATVTYTGSALTPCTASYLGAGSLSGTLTPTYSNNTNAGTATANASYAGDTNHISSSDSENFTIDKASLTVTADNKSMIFGQALPAFTFQYSGFVNGESASVVDVAPTCGVGSIPSYGTYPIVCSGGSDNNYSFHYVNGTLTVQAWTFGGFYQPVDMNGVYNTVKGGSTVPLKFEVFAGSTEQTSTSAVKSFTQATITCSGTALTDDIEVVTTGGTSLRYDATGGQFIQNWKTPTGAGTCYRVTLTTQDGSSLVAFFKLK